MAFVPRERFWRVVAVASVVPVASLLTPVVVGEAVCGLIVLGVVVSVARRRASLTSLRLLSVGCVLIGFAPVVSELHRSLLGADSFTSGDVVGLAGYAVCLAGLQRLVRVRTVERQIRVVLDALSVTAWLSLAIAFATVEDVIDQSSVSEAAVTLAYLPLTLGLVFMLLRLGLGAGERSAAFAFLAAAVSAAAISELLFLEAATVDGGFIRRLAVVAATLGVVFFAAAFSHPSAAGLEEPRPPTLQRTSRRFAALLGLSMMAAITVPLVLDIRAVEAALLVIIGLVTASRAVLIVVERDEWLSLQRVVSDFAAAVAESDDVDAIHAAAKDAAERLTSRKTLSFVDYRDEADVDDAIANEPDPAGAVANEIDGDVWSALRTGQTQRREWLVEGGRPSYATRLVVPVDAGPAGRGVLIVESSPVLSTTEIFHLEQLASGIGAAISTTIGRQLQQSERANQRFRSLVQDSNDVVMLVDRDTFEARLVSPTVERLLGYTEAECLGAHPLQFVVLEDGGHLLTSLESAAAAAKPADFRLVQKSGEVRWFSVTVRIIDDDDLEGLIVSLTDVHDRKMAELQLVRSERRYRGLVETSRDIFAVLDRHLCITFVSPNVERLLQLSPNDLLGATVTSLVAESSADAVKELIDANPADVSGRSIEIELISGQGEKRWFEIAIADEVTDPDGLVVTARDIHARRELEQSMREATLHDDLTGLHNRPAFQYEVHQGLQSLDAGSRLAVLHLDVRDFKVVNESLGFEAGDALLTRIGARIRSGLRSDDGLARFGADSFGIVTVVRDADELGAMADRLVELFEEPFDAGSRQWSVSMSIGMTITESRRASAVVLLEEAAIAVRQAKVEGGGVVLFEPEMREVANERFELESDLLPGLRAGEFHIVFQPLLALATQRVRSVEALLRWDHPERGPVSPGRFIPVAERSGAIIELGRWVLEQSCRQLRTWHEELPDATGLGVSVNVSVRQLTSESEFERLRSIIVDSGVDPAALTLELTESLVINEVPTVRRGVENLRAVGVKIAVDDFGSGTAGLNHLRDVPFDILKIDKSYVDPLGVNPEAYQLLASVVELAHSMDAIVVAEGIEAHEQAVLLRRMGCDVGQGFYLGRPMDPVKLEDWFASGRDGVEASQIVAPGK